MQRYNNNITILNPKEQVKINNIFKKEEELSYSNYKTECPPAIGKRDTLKQLVFETILRYVRNAVLECKDDFRMDMWEFYQTFPVAAREVQLWAAANELEYKEVMDNGKLLVVISW